MSRLSIDAPQPGEARASQPVNTAFSAIATVSTILTADNFVREGIDYRCLGSTTAIERVLHQVASTATTFNNTTAAILVLGATTFSGAVTVAANERLLLRGSVAFETDVAGPTWGIVAARYVGVDFTDDNGATTIGGARTRRGVFASVTGGNGILRTFHVITTPGTYTIGLMTFTDNAASNYRVARASFAVTRYKVQ